MGADTKIEWCDYTFNHVRGCTKVSPGCANCYAETMSGRNPKSLGVWGPQGKRVVGAESYWREPVKWNRAAAAAGDRRRVFCASLADVFEDWNGDLHNSQGVRLWCDRVVPDKGGWFAETPQGSIACLRPLRLDDVRRRLFALIDATPHLDWLILTKRPENIARMMPPRTGREPIFPGCPGPLGEPQPCIISGGFRANVWLGTSVEDQQRADERIPHLLATPAAVRFLSVEPLLGPVDLGKIKWAKIGGMPHGLKGHSLRNVLESREEQRIGDVVYAPELPRIDWVIVGGESGTRARPCDVAWVRSLVEQCKAASVPVFVKQLGGAPRVAYYHDTNDLRDWALDHTREVYWPNGAKHEEHDGQPPVGCVVFPRLLDRKGGDPAEWPEDLRVREFPSVEAVAR